MERELETLVPLDFQEADDVAFIYKDDLTEGESATTAEVTVEVVAGVDRTPNLLKVGSASINPVEGYVVQRLQGRMPNVTYKLRCRITLSPTNRVLVKAGLLPVVRV